MECLSSRPSGPELPSPSVERVQRLLRPVSAEARGGTDARLGDHFDRIQSEIAKLLQASNHGGDIDWRLVVDRSEALLVGEAKDLRAAVYLAAAWHRVEGWSGLQRGFDLLSGLLADYWDEVFPPLAKVGSRAEVLTWLSDRLRIDLPATLGRADVEQVRTTWSAFAAFREVVRAKFPDRGPALGPIEHVFAQLPADKRPAPERGEPQPPALVTDGPADAEDEILRAIAGADPAGEDPRLCDEFEQLRVEIAKVGSVAGVDAAWPNVAALSRKILAHRSKDLRCLIYLAIARLRTEGARGLCDAVAGLAACTERYADALHPRRPKARSGALEWFGQRLQAEVLRQPPVIGAEELTRLRADVARVAKALAQLCDDTNGLAQADEALGRIKPRGHAAHPVVRAATTAPPKPRPIASGDGVTNELELADTLLAAARARAAAGQEDATTMRLRRLGLWMTAPEVLAAKKHECDSGAPQQRAELAALASAENWVELLRRCEVELELTPFWLDLTYWTIKAAEHVHGKDAARTLKGELVALVMRHPTLLGGFDRKGQWLASKEVRDWFARELTPRPPSTEGAEPAAQDSVAKPAPVAQALPAAAETLDTPELPADVQELLKAKKFDEALGHASPWIAAVSGRSRFARSVVLARHCAENGQAKLALPLYRALEGQLRKSTISDWDPNLVIQCIRGYLGSKLASGLALGPQDEHLVDELALLDPRAMSGLIR